MSTALGSGPQDPSSSTPRALPKPPTRKPPPSPLAISSSSLSPHSRLTPANSSSNPSSSTSTFANGRNSLESSRSDLTSVRSDLTSLRVSEFPLPPSGLPAIPASPRTPKSLFFSTTPTTPRSRSPQSGFAYQQQDPPKSPRSLKSLKFFSTTPRSQSPQSGRQQQHPPSPGRNDSQLAGSPFEDPQHGYVLPRDEGPVHYSQYAVYKESGNGASTSRPATPTTAGTMTPRDWPSSSGRSSPLQPPRPAYSGSRSPGRVNSPLRNEPFSAQQEEGLRPSHSPVPSRSVSPAPRSPRSVSPQPPRSPLPVPPRDSTRYSHIARHAGVTDMGMDISEEELLSTDFITEMLNHQPCEFDYELPVYIAINGIVSSIPSFRTVSTASRLPSVSRVF
jgi:hypothetical protein